MPAPTIPLTDAQFMTYQNGKLFESFWSKLSKRQQRLLMDISEGKKNKEKLVEEIKKQYPDIAKAPIYEQID